MKNLFKKQSAIFVQNPSRFTKVMAKHILVWFYAPQCTRIITVGSTIAQRLCDAVRIINRLSYNHPCWWQLGRNRDHQTSTTTKCWWHTVYFSASAPLWTRTIVAYGHKF